MVTTDAIARTLRTLAERTATAKPPYAGVIEEADAALGELDRAASFVDTDGLIRLSEATDSARRDEREELAERGETALGAYQRLREAAAGDVTRSPEHRGRTPPEKGSPSEPNRSVRGTHIPQKVQRSTNDTG
ncbi:hypothetical protein [Halalkaliarchaeum desulfuricum]|uniref:hypothetical protein n=1 Tax=Halalkaliarchaeum desulfuricum TaxID=2055893 RepID=UPI001877C491|nr:hypothetical protein [Halalkaliarchaeum desulfuricum]